jgi:hypothetical protein
MYISLLENIIILKIEFNDLDFLNFKSDILYFKERYSTHSLLVLN